MKAYELQPGATVQQGDEWFDARDGCWEATTAHTWGAPCPADMRIRRSTAFLLRDLEIVGLGKAMGYLPLASLEGLCDIISR